MSAGFLVVEYLWDLNVGDGKGWETYRYAADGVAHRISHAAEDA